MPLFTTSLMTLDEWKTVTEIASNMAVVLAAFVGGFWALRRYHRERTDEAALEIGFQYKTRPADPDYLIEIDVVVTNKGKTKIEANTTRKEGYAYNDGVEKLKHSASLQLRQVQPWQADEKRHLEWFESSLLTSVAGLCPEINLLSDYEDPAGGLIQFWMEPGEIYHLSAVLILPAGHYVAKVTFIGADDGDFWSRVAAISIPADSSEPMRDSEILESPTSNAD